MALYKKLCIIDDDEIFTIVAKAQLEELGFADSIIDFSDGTYAFEFFEENPKSKYPEIILLDINMNMMDGWEFLEALQPLNILQDIEVFITSSSIDPVDIERAKTNYHVNAFISKPLNMDKLKNIANNRIEAKNKIKK